MVANGDLKLPKTTVELKFEVGDIEFYEIFIVLEKLSSPIIELMFLQRNHTVLDMRQGMLKFPFFSMQVKTADHKQSNVMEPILNPEDVTIPPNDRTIIPIQCQMYAENAVTGIRQPSELLNEENDITFCAAIVTLKEGTTRIQVNNFTDQPYKLKKGMHIANFSLMTSEQMKHVRRLDPVSTWHLLIENQEDLFIILAVFLKPTEINTNTSNIGFQHPKIQGTKRSIRQYKNEFSENCKTCKKQKFSIHRKIKNLGKSSSVTLTGRTQCYNSMNKTNKSSLSGVPRYICPTLI